MSGKDHGADHGPGVRIPPPAWLLLCSGGAWLLDQVAPIPIGPPAAPLGGMVGALGFGVIGWALLTMLRARTDPMPHTADSTLVTHGPFRISRNPIYLGFLLLATAFALAQGTLFAWIAVALLHLLLSRLVIAKEEAYLATRFGAAYAAYRARVRRWM